MAKIPLRTSRDMVFRVNGEIVVIRKYTRCEKVPYNSSIKKYIDNMEKRSINRPDSKPNAVCIKLKGECRYVWRTDVLTDKEYDEIRKREKENISRIFRQKFKGTMVQGNSKG